MTDNSQLSHNARLLTNICRDVYLRLPLRVVPANQIAKLVGRDSQTIMDHALKDGLKFFTVSLPLLGKWLDKYLETNEVWDLPKFVKYDESGLPLLLGKAFHFALEQRDGEIEEEVELRSQIIRYLRTFCFAFYKAEVPCEESLNAEAINRFLDNDALCGVPWSVSAHTLIDRARPLLAALFSGFDPKNIQPSHGPGAVATGERGDEKWVFTHFYPSLHQYYPYYDYMYGVRENGRTIQLAAMAKRYRNMDHGLNPTSKVVLVPKDSRGPRIICCEPLEYQFIQQGLSREIVRLIETHSITKGFVNFTSQEVNRQLALTSSRTLEYATIDMKDASDLVSVDLVRALMPPRIWDALAATRTTHVRLPDGREIVQNKFAPMGSALCFPIESLVFWAICKSSLAHFPGESTVYVYGDDIIVPTAHVGTVIAALEMVGLRVNHEKCCYRGSFRESCGMDAWKGYQVTPIRFKKYLAHGSRSAEAHSAYASYAGALYDSGMYHTAMYIETLLRDSLGFIPRTSRPEAYLSIVTPPRLVTPLKDYPNVRWDANVQLPSSVLWCVKSRSQRTELGSWDRLNRDILSRLRAEHADRQTGKNSPVLTKKRKLLYVD